MQLSYDASLDLLEGAGAAGVEESETGERQVHYPLADVGAPTVKPSMLTAFAAMEEDDPMGPMGEMVQPEVQRSPTKEEFPPSTARLDDSERIIKLFPNSFKVAGIKHVCDNALSSILKSLPKFPDTD